MRDEREGAAAAATVTATVTATAAATAAALLEEPGGRGGGAGAGARPAAAAETAQVYPIREWSDVAIARHQARRAARDAGFAPRQAGAVAIVVSELASNIVKYGVSGEIAIRIDPGAAAGGRTGEAGTAASAPSPAAGGGAITVMARDVGPPIHDVATAMLDGHNDRGPIDPAALAQRGGLGTGLGAVGRLADRLEVLQEEGGKQITATFLRRPARGA